MTNFYSIFHEFKNELISIKDLSKKYNIPQEEIKRFLRAKLKANYYRHIKRISGHYGGRVFAHKLRNDSQFRDIYSKNMSAKVSLSINKKLQHKPYKDQWIRKVRAASVLAHKKVNYLLETDSNFRSKWIKNCRKGGKQTYSQSKGAYDPQNREKRLLGSIRGLQHTTRKSIGPKGELMYNLHEVKVAKVILQFAKQYIYEKRYIVQNQNGYISCDFVIPLSPLLIIEATYWDDAKEKCARFKQKHNMLKSLFQDNFQLIIVVNTKTLKDKYLQYLPSFQILTIKELEEYLKNMNLAGVGRSKTNRISPF